MDILIKLIIVYAVIGFIFTMFYLALLMLAIKLAETNASASKVVGMVSFVAHMEKCSFGTAMARMLTSFFLKWPYYVLVTVKRISNNGGN